MSESKPAPQLALLVDKPEESDGGFNSHYLVATISFVAREGDEVRNLGWEDYGRRPFAEYADLRFRAQMDNSATGKDSWYGWSLEYHQPWAVSYARAVAMAKVLKRIEDKIKEQNDFLGSAPDFVSYVMRVASVCKVRNFAWIRRYGGNYQNSETMWVDPDGVRNRMNMAAQEFIARWHPDAQPETPVAPAEMSAEQILAEDR